MTTNNKYLTEKLTFAAYLIASGKCELVGTEPVPGSRNVVFVLSENPSDEEISGFFNGSAQVSALRYSEVISSLKGIAFEARKKNTEGRY